MRSVQAQTNLRVAYFFSFVSQMFFPIAIWLFFYTKYLTFKEIALISAFGYVASILFEIPTGAFADIVGRKKAIILSYFIFSATMLGMAFSTSFLMFLIFIIVGSFGDALYSGSLEALVYDSLKENGEEGRFVQATSRMETLTWLGLFFGSILGGFMYQYWFRLPYITQAVMTFVAGVSAIKLVEPHIDSKKYKLSDFLVQNTQGIRELFGNIKTAQLSIIFIVIGAGYVIAASILGISQAKEYGIEPQIVGILFAAGYVVAALGSHFYPKVKQKVGGKVLLVTATSMLIASFIFAKFVGVLFGAFFIFMRIATSSTFRNTRSILFNEFFSSKNRATALSTLTLLTNLPYAILAYFIGGYIDKTSPNSFAFVLGVGIIVLLAVQQGAFGIIKNRSLKPIS
ncbi:MFS transporter [Candidatus Collierbacteria bacterium]|nr:MFS transporter [Candidatus Collierbacteria bacterium]